MLRAVVRPATHRQNWRRVRLVADQRINAPARAGAPCPPRRNQRSIPAPRVRWRARAARSGATPRASGTPAPAPDPRRDRGRRRRQPTHQRYSAQPNLSPARAAGHVRQRLFEPPTWRAPRIRRLPREPPPGADDARHGVGQLGAVVLHLDDDAAIAIARIRTAASDGMPTSWPRDERPAGVVEGRVHALPAPPPSAPPADLTRAGATEVGIVVDDRNTVGGQAT